MEEIVKRCKASVHLEINDHKSVYQTVQDWLNEMNARGNPLEDTELAERMIRENCIYELQFYPDTPIGSYTVYGTSLNEVIKKALDILK